MSSDPHPAHRLPPHRPESNAVKPTVQPEVHTVTFSTAEDMAFKADYCGRGAIVGLSTDGNEIVVVPLRCKAWDCHTCGPVRRHRTAARIASGLPNKFITLTTKKDDTSKPADRFKLAKNAFPVLVKRIRAKFGSFQYATVWELSASGSAHCHIAARSDFIPQAWLSNQWKELTDSEIVDIRAVKDVRKVAYYVVKYMLKAASETNYVLDGARLLQFSADYDLPIDPEEPQPESIPFVWKWVDKSLWQLLGDLHVDICDWQIEVKKSGCLFIHRRPASDRITRLWFTVKGENVILEV